MRLLHTSDWHLGHVLHRQSREYEHQCFLDWLIETAVSEAIDALVITGDIFDTTNPSAAAQAQYYRFLAEFRRLLPNAGVIVIGGNHDSAGRLVAPAPLLDAFNMSVVGALPRLADGGIDIDSLLIPITVANTVVAWVAAVPYLRRVDLGAADDTAEALRGIYDEVLSEALERREPGQALIATGHLFLVGSQVSSLSERRIISGGEHAVGGEMFPPGVAYAALGHLHKAQRVAGEERVRYAGSPIPLSLGEAKYKHQVVIASFQGQELDAVQVIPIPRSVEMMRIPSAGAAGVDEVVAELEALPDWSGHSGDPRRPYLEVFVRLDEPDPHLRGRLEEALAGKEPRLVKITRESLGSGLALAQSASQSNLRDLAPEEVFRRRYERSYEGEPDPSLVQAFREVYRDALESEA